MDGNSKHQHRDTMTGLARGLGWFSIGLGAVQLLAPRWLSRPLGMRGQEGVLRAYGLREIATGIGILTSREPAPWVTGRVLGDALDIGTVASGSRLRPGLGLGAALVALAGVALLDAFCARELTERSRRKNRRLPDYSGRSGFRGPAEAARGIARAPVALVPETSARRSTASV